MQTESYVYLQSPGAEVAYKIKSRMTLKIWPDILPCHWLCYLTLLRIGGAKGPPTNFSPVTSTNVQMYIAKWSKLKVRKILGSISYIGNSPKSFLNFSFDHFATLVSNFKAIPSVSLMITSLIEMLELPNFSH